MQFRPCIDIHNGKVKQIVGATLRDAGDFASVNFEAVHGAEWYAGLYKRDGIHGAHVIMLNSRDSEYYEATRREALSALSAYPGGLQIGGGITADNAADYIEAGASHVIVTSYVFSDGHIHMDRLKLLADSVGPSHIVLDLSAGLKDGNYYVVTNRWQNFTDEKVEASLFEKLAPYCDEFLVHATNVEGKKQGPDEKLLKILSESASKYTITYAGGIATMEDIELINNISNGKLNFTVGSALDLYGGNLKYEKLVSQGF